MLRVLLTPRWLGWTLLAVAAVVVCGGMAYWQLLRAESATGSLLNAGYALQWPLFGVFFAALWWRMLRAEAGALDVLVEGPADGLPDVADDRTTAAPDEVAPGAAGAPSPFTPRPHGVAAVAAADVAPGSARAEYNAMLAELARRDTRENAP